MDKLSIKIGLFGAVSVGKSMLLNAIAGVQYSDSEIKKTTMIPQAYTEKSDTTTISEPSYIRTKNKEINEHVSSEIETGSFSLSKCQVLHHSIGKLYDLVENSDNSDDTQIVIYDTPGLNDSASKDIYFSWVKNNLEMFDIIIFVTDILHGLNNSDEVEILQLLIESLKNSKSRMICVINKCDDIYFDQQQNDLVFEDKEKENIYIQANNILYELIKKK